MTKRKNIKIWNVDTQDNGSFGALKLEGKYYVNENSKRNVTSDVHFKMKGGNKAAVKVDKEENVVNNIKQHSI